jgi:hypothetical protein
MTSKLLTVLIILTYAKSCNRADFERPQPDDTKNLTLIPSKLHGKYISLTDSSILYITNKSIIVHKTEIHSMHKNELDSIESKNITRDTIFHEDNTIFDVKIFGDSLKAKLTFTDTLIYISSDMILRKYKGQYFLNKRKSELKWEVKTIAVDNNDLTLSSTQTKEDINTLRQLLRTSDTTLIFNPTKKQFGQFLKQGGFKDKEVYRRE